MWKQENIFIILYQKDKRVIYLVDFLKNFIINNKIWNLSQKSFEKCVKYHESRLTFVIFLLEAYEQDFSAFKLYLLDVGLLCAMADVDATTIIDGNEIFVEFKEALTEQYVLTELKTNTTENVYYWSSDRGSSKVDYIIQLGRNNIPVEVKANENLQAKSLKTFVQKYNTKINVRTSMANYRKEEWLLNIPLYLIGNISEIIKKI